MKQLLMLTIAFLTINVVSGQKQIVWFDAGLKAQIGGANMISKDISDHPDVNYELGFTNAFGIGGRFGINWNYSGLSLEGMYNSGSIKIESLSGEEIPAFDYTNIDIYALYRTSKNLGYFELGPKVSLLNKMSSGSRDLKNQFNNTNYAGVLGFGANVIGSDGAFTGILGLRLEYGFTDWINADGKAANLPASPAVPTFVNKASTTPVFAGLVFELNWGIGYYGVAQCGQRAKFVMF